MNWYKIQMNKEAKGMWTAFGWLTIPAIIALIGGAVFEQLKANPQELKAKVEQVQQEQHPEPEVIQEQIPEPSIVQEQNAPVNIDLNKIHQIESRGGQLLWNKETKARGHFQFVKKTWDEMVGRMGKDWDWWNDSMDYEKSKQVADFYYNKRIPYLLNNYGIPDTIETRIGAYNWGIGYLKKIWKKHGENWLSNTPSETQEYVQKYK